MCGIAGYVDFTSGTPEAAILAAMTRVLRRRGPDAQATLVDGPCGLAHTRLSIIDVAGSPQPMRVGASDLSLVFNGEIYNYQALRAELAKLGCPFEHQGDTEVLLRSVERDGKAALPRFEGMFAFGAWDRRRETLLLARDAIGEKPLFYATPHPGMIIFGSEIKAVLKHPAVDRELDVDALRQVLRFRAVYGEGSLHRGVRQLPPGHYIEFSRSGLQLGRFWDLPAEVRAARERMRGKSEAVLLSEGEDLFHQSIRHRLVADVPVGAFLSGGLDSSLIVASVQKLRPKELPLETFAVGFRNDDFSELPYAKMVADVIGTSHTEVHVSEDEYIARLAELTGCRDAPISEPADVAIAQMSRVARQRVKVVLSGEGADEVFAGYPKYVFANAPQFIGTAVRLLGVDRSTALAGMLGLDRRRARVAARALAHPRELDRVIQWFSYLDRADLQQLLPGLNWTDRDWLQSSVPQEEAMRRFARASHLDLMQGIDCLTWLPGNMLERGDRMTMAEGLEVRPPFLEKSLVAFGLALPPRMRVRGSVGKWTVRQWAKRILPPQIMQRKKWGFRVPLAQWFRGSMKAMTHDLLLSSDGLCARYGNRAAIARLLAEHDSGKIDANLSLWTLLTAEIWYRSIYRSGHSDTVEYQTDLLAS